MKKIFIVVFLSLFYFFFTTAPIKAAIVTCVSPNVCSCTGPPANYTSTGNQCNMPYGSSCGYTGTCYAPDAGGGCLTTGTRLSNQDCSPCCSKLCSFDTAGYYCSSGGCSVGTCYSSCPDKYTKVNGICYTNGNQGVCCSPSTPPPDGGGTGPGTGPWGSPGTGPSLQSVSNLLGINAPQSASKASFNSIVALLLNLLIVAAILLSLLFLIWGGIDWITSGGDKQKLQSARHKIIFALVGLVIVFASFFIINFLQGFFGIK